MGIRIKSWVASPLGRLLVCSTLYQAIWFGVVLTATRSSFVLMGPLLVLLTVGIQCWLWPSLRSRGLKLAGAALLTGLLVDSVLTALGVLVPYRHFMPYPLTPIWLLSLWAGFGIYIALGLERLYGRLVLAAIGGLIGGPLAYRGGVPFGAMSVGSPAWAALLLVGCVWAVVFIFLIWLAGRWSTSSALNSPSGLPPPPKASSRKWKSAVWMVALCLLPAGEMQALNGDESTGAGSTRCHTS